MDQYEEIKISGDDKQLQDALKSANKGVIDFEKAAVASEGRRLKATEETEARRLNVTTTTETTRKRLLAQAERAATSAGRTAVQQLQAERDILIGRLEGDQAKIARATAAFERRINIKQYEQLFDEADRRAAQSAAKQAEKQAAYNQSLNAAVKASERATKGANEFESALRKVNTAQRDAIASNEASIASLERRNSLAGKSGIAKLEIERGFALQDFGKTPADVQRINSTFNRQRDEKQLEAAIKASGDAAKATNQFQQALVNVNRQQAISKQTAYDQSLNAAVKASKAAAAGANEFDAALRKVNSTQRAAVASNEASIASLQRRAALAGKTGTAKLDVERGFALQDFGKTQADIDRINSSFNQLRANVASGTSGFIASAKNWAVSLVSVAAAWQVIQFAVASVRQLINQSRDFQELGLSLGALFKDAEAGKKVFGDLVGIVREFPRAFSLQTIGENAKLLAAFKFTAAEVPDILRKIAGAAILGADRINRLIIATGQIKSKGVLQAEEALQFAEAGVEIYGTLAKAAGVTELEIRKLGEKGFLKADAVLPVILNEIQRTFSGAQKAVDEQTRTIEARLRADVLQASVPIGNAIDQVYRGALKSLEGFVPAIRAIGIELKNSEADIVGVGTTITDALVNAASFGSINLRQYREEAARAAEAKKELDKSGFLTNLSSTSGKPGVDLAASGYTQERALELFGQVRGRQIADQFKLVSLEQQGREEADKKLRLSIEQAKAVGDREKAAKQAADNAKDNAETLARLDADRLGALRQFITGSKELGSVQEKILNTTRQLREKGASGAQVAEAERSIRTAALLEGGYDRQRKGQQEIEAATRKATAAVQENFNAQLRVKELEESIVRSRVERMDQLNQLDDENRIQRTTDTLTRTRDLELAQLDGIGQRTVRDRVVIANKKLEIEIAFQRKLAEVEDSRLRAQRDKEVAFFQSARFATTDPAVQAAIDGEIGRVNQVYADQRRAATDAVVANETILRTQAAAQISQIQIDEQAKVFDYWKSAFSSTIDALFSRTRSFGDAVKNVLRAAFLTPLKEASATFLSSLVTGQKLQPAGLGQNSILQGLFGIGGAAVAPVPRQQGGTATLGTQTALAAILGGGGGIVPGFGSPNAPGGTPTFSGQPAGGGAAAAASSLGLFGGFKNLSGMLTKLGNLGRGTNVFANPGATPAGFGGVAGGLALLGGGVLAADGLRRGGLLGLGQTTAGGALIGAKFGGPVGAAIGAGIGAAAGTVRLFIKGASEKAQREIKNVYGVDVTEKNILKMVIDIARQSYGGDLRMAVRSQQVAELVQLYGMSTGKYSSAIANVQRPVLFLQSGGQLFQQAQYAGGNPVSFQSPVPSITPTQTIPSGGQAPTQVTLQLDGPTTERLQQGQAVNVLARQPGLVAKAASTGMRQNSGRDDLRGITLEPLTV